MLQFDTDSLFLLGFYVTLLVFSIHSLVLIYHWLHFGADKKQSFTIAAVYLFGGAVLLIALVTYLTIL